MVRSHERLRYLRGLEEKLLRKTGGPREHVEHEEGEPGRGGRACGWPAAAAASWVQGETEGAAAHLGPVSTEAGAREENQDALTLTEVYEQLRFLDAATADTRARTILCGLGFTQAMCNQPTSSLSGGWRMRVALACTIFVDPDILLLDEPTVSSINHSKAFFRARHMERGESGESGGERLAWRRVA